VFEARCPLGGELGPRQSEGAHEVEHVRQVERAVVVKVVSDEPVGDGRLRRDGLDGRMRVDHRHRRVEAGIGDSPDADVSVVVRDVLHHPVDGVPGVARFIDILRSLLGGDVGTHVDELALAHEASADILVNKDVLRARVKKFRGAEMLGILIFAVGRHGVRRAVEHHWIGVRSRRVLGHVDGGEEACAIAHGNAVLELGVTGADELGKLLFLVRLRDGSSRQKQHNSERNKRSRYGAESFHRNPLGTRHSGMLELKHKGEGKAAGERAAVGQWPVAVGRIRIK
jgi:hypothetical protein